MYPFLPGDLERTPRRAVPVHPLCHIPLLAPLRFRNETRGHDGQKVFLEGGARLQGLWHGGIEGTVFLVAEHDAVVGVIEGYPDGLAELGPAHLEELRQVYFAELDNHLESEDRSAVVVDKLPLKVHTVRYESLIETFEETLIPLLDFLGVEWDDSVRNYTGTASRRDRITTPSYYQVTQPLYTRARGRWERYSEYMQPVLLTLLPWAKRFGYGE